MEGRSEGVIQPQLNSTHFSEDKTHFEDWAIGVHEWLGLVAIQSPRVTEKDDVDTFLSQYRVPTLNEQNDAAVTDIVTLKWRGLISAAWVNMLFVCLQCVSPSYDRFYTR